MQRPWSHVLVMKRNDESDWSFAIFSVTATLAHEQKTRVFQDADQVFWPYDRQFGHSLGEDINAR